jgi:hypothetical protein
MSKFAVGCQELQIAADTPSPPKSKKTKPQKILDYHSKSCVSSSEILDQLQKSYIKDSPSSTKRPTRQNSFFKNTTIPLSGLTPNSSKNLSKVIHQPKPNPQTLKSQNNSTLGSQQFDRKNSNEMMQSLHQIEQKLNLNSRNTTLSQYSGISRGDGGRGFIAGLRKTFGGVEGETGRVGVGKKKEERRRIVGKIEMLKKEMAGVMREFAVYNNNKNWGDK